MSWLSDNVTVVGTPVDGVANVLIALPGTNKAIATNLRDAIVAVVDLVEESPQPEPTQNAFYPILSSMKW